MKKNKKSDRSRFLVFKKKHKTKTLKNHLFHPCFREAADKQTNKKCTFTYLLTYTGSQSAKHTVLKAIKQPA